MDDAEKQKIRAAFAYMGPQTQDGLTLEALAKGAGILIRQLRGEVAAVRSLLRISEMEEAAALLLVESSKTDHLACERQLKGDRAGLELQIDELKRRLAQRVSEHCSCGGAGPEDGCDWCKAYHYVFLTQAAKPVEPLQKIKVDGCNLCEIGYLNHTHKS